MIIKIFKDLNNEIKDISKDKVTLEVRSEGITK